MKHPINILKNGLAYDNGAYHPPSKLKTISPLTLTNFAREKTKNMTN